MLFSEMTLSEKIRHYLLMLKYGGRKNRALVQEAYDQEKFLRTIHRDLLTPKGRGDCFPKEILRCLDLLGPRPRIIEIGSGPLSYFAWGQEQGLFRLVATDPLADEYNRFIRKHNISYPVRPIKGWAEKLTMQFGQESFDMVVARNSLDHVKDVGSAFDNIYKILKIKGIIYLEFFLREGSREKWGGLHKFDLFIDNGNLVCSARNGQITKLTETKNLECLFALSGSYCKVAYRKI